MYVWGVELSGPFPYLNWSHKTTESKLLAGVSGIGNDLVAGKWSSGVLF
jgi:hypothetical protein